MVEIEHYFIHCIVDNNNDYDDLLLNKFIILSGLYWFNDNVVDWFQTPEVPFQVWIMDVAMATLEVKDSRVSTILDWSSWPLPTTHEEAKVTASGSDEAPRTVAPSATRTHPTAAFARSSSTSGAISNGTGSDNPATILRTSARDLAPISWVPTRPMLRFYRFINISIRTRAPRHAVPLKPSNL